MIMGEPAWQFTHVHKGSIKLLLLVDLSFSFDEELPRPMNIIRFQEDKEWKTLASTGRDCPLDAEVRQLTFSSKSRNIES